jgi:hypothetical protein
MGNSVMRARKVALGWRASFALPAAGSGTG